MWGGEARGEEGGGGGGGGGEGVRGGAVGIDIDTTGGGEGGCGGDWMRPGAGISGAARGHCGDQLRGGRTGDRQQAGGAGGGSGSGGAGRRVADGRLSLNGRWGCSRQQNLAEPHC